MGRLIHGMKEVEELVEQQVPLTPDSCLQEFSGPVFAWSIWSDVYYNLHMIDLLTPDMLKSVGLTLLAILLCTLLLTADVATSMLTMVPVGLTVVGTAGLGHYWALDLSPFVAILLSVSAGLCVDYTTHIGHTFLHQVPLPPPALQAGATRAARSRATLVHSGPHVLHGGLSTLLCVLPLGLVGGFFKTIVKIFVLLVVLGLFHALLLLPTLLARVGPRPIATRAPAARGQ